MADNELDYYYDSQDATVVDFVCALWKDGENPVAEATYSAFKVSRLLPWYTANIPLDVQEIHILRAEQELGVKIPRQLPGLLDRVSLRT